MVIIYPHNQRFFLRRAHDILVIKTCHALAREGHDVYLLMGQTCRDTSKLTEYYGLVPHPRLHFIQLPILRRERWPRFSWHGVFNFFCFRKIRKMLVELNPDLIYLSEIKFGYALFQTFKNLPVPVVYEVHGLTGKNYVEPRDIEAEVFRRSDSLITTTESLKKVIYDTYPDSASVSCVPLATEEIMTENFRIPVPGEPWRLCYVGQLYPLQGVDILIRAIALLDDFVHLDIYGGKPDHINDLQKLSIELGVEDQIFFHGFVSPGEVLKRASNAQICVIPCRSDKKMSFVAHTKLYEYMSIGRAIIAADLPSIREEVIDGESAVLFSPGNERELSKAIHNLINNPEFVRELARMAHLNSKNFTWKTRAQKISKVFQSVCMKN